MWCGPIAEDADFFSILVHVGDKNISDVAFVDFNTGASRETGKLDSEGGHFCSHVLLKKTPDAFGRHLIMAEKVPGIHFASLKSHFNWALQHPNAVKTMILNGEPRPYKGTTEIDGYQSKTVMQAMTSGTVLDVQFVGHQALTGGLDEAAIIREKVNEVKWGIGRQLNAEETSSLIRRGIDFLRGWDDVEEGSKELLVRVKSESGQIKTASVNANDGTVDDATEDALGSAFQLNELINGFDAPLTQRYADIRQDVIEKMNAKANNLPGA